MKRDIKVLTHEVEKKIGKKVGKATDFEKLATLFSVKHHLKVSAQGLHKVWVPFGKTPLKPFKAAPLPAFAPPF